MAVRDLGKGLVDFIRPDNGQALNFDLMTSVGRGVVDRITGLTPARATDVIVNGVSKTATDPTKPLASVKNLPSLLKNPLENFASFNSVWTLACLTPQQFNNPPSYRNSPADLKHVVLSSAGRFDSQRVQTTSGVPEFFISNFSMKSVITAGPKTGNTNAFKFEWDIYEPYSMGLLLQSLQLAAVNAGYVNYLNNAPYVLRLDFMGFDDQGIQYTILKPKYFVLKLVGVKFTVNESGSSYKVEAIPYNHQGFSDTINTAYNDVKITAGEKGSVEEALVTGKESLVKVLNDVEDRLLADGLISEKDEYNIQFPNSSSEFTSVGKIKNAESATVDPKAAETLTVKGRQDVALKTDFDTNPIGRASFGFSQSSGGNFVMKKEGDQRDPATGVVKRDNMTIDPKNRTFQFSQGQTLTAIINQMVLSSDYVKEAIDPKSTTGRTADGFIKWFRLDVQVELLKFDDLTGDYARRFTYRVVPFLVHESIFANPNTALKYDDLKKKICKGYDYIYTGQNVDVLKFDITINNAFFTGITPSAPNSAGQASDPNTSGGTSTQKNATTKTGKGPATGAKFASGGRSRPLRDPKLLDKSIKGGSNQEDSQLKVAEAFHKAFTENQTEMVTIVVEILGDPFWMVDSGFANYFSPGKKASPQQTEDGTMNYESGDVYIYLSFKTPVDINEATGLYDFGGKGTESPFSGVYKVTQCESVFNEGTFKQKLSCLRMPGQAIDTANAPKEVNATIKRDNATVGAIVFGPDEKPKSTPTDESKIPPNWA